MIKCAAIDVCGVSKVFESDAGRVVALKDVNLQVPHGAFVSVIGPSGCGKTSLMRIVGDLEVPTSGMVRVNGKMPAEARKAREIGVVFQSPALMGWRTVEENVRLPGEIFNDTKVGAQAHEMIRAVGLQGFEQSYPRQLSGGMQSRVAIARALTYRPDVLLMDEPFGALDEMTRERMQLELLRIWRGAKPAVLFITHSIPEAILLSDRVVVMSARPGRLVGDLQVDFPRPRNVDLLARPRFVEMVAHLRTLLAG